MKQNHYLNILSLFSSATPSDLLDYRKCHAGYFLTFWIVDAIFSTRIKEMEASDDSAFFPTGWANKIS